MAKKEIKHIIIEKFKNEDEEIRKQVFNDKFLNYIIAMEKKNGITLVKV